ncbi:MAG: lamin tail domain-containing protein [Pirellulales bacterium]
MAYRAKSRRPRFLFERLEERQVLAAGLVISEFLAANNGGLTDEDGDRPDWIELYNGGADAVDLAGYHLTDDAALLGKWTFPSTTIDSGGFLVVFASDKNRAVAGSELHTNFKLNDNGEYLALVAPDAEGGTIVDQFDPAFPNQRTDVSYGRSIAETVLVGAGNAARILIPGGPVSGDWTGGAEPFDEATWTAGDLGVGYPVTTPISPPVSGSGTAFTVTPGAIGNQEFGGSLGMDFEVSAPITVTQLGVFDSGANGLSRTITGELWSRVGNTGTRLAQLAFTTASPGTLASGSRFKSLAAPLELQPGSYTIVAHGYGVGEPNGNSGGAAGGFGTTDGGGVVSFVGGGRYGTAGQFPATPDAGPTNRYGAGTFTYSYSFTPVAGLANPSFESLALADDGFVNGSVPGWSQSGAVAGTWNPNEPRYTGANDQTPDLDTIVPEGRNVAFINGAGILSQTLADLLQTNTTYTLSAFAGQRSDMLVNLSYTLRLSAGGVELGSASGITPGPNTWTPIELTVSTGSSHPQAGQPIVVELINTSGSQVNFDGVGFTTLPAVRTNVESTMKDVNATALVRATFDVADPAAFDSFKLRMRYDDGFVAYLNGVEITRRNAPATPAHDSAATMARPDGASDVAEDIPLTAFLGTLQAGANVLAIHGLNASAGDDDFLILPELIATTVDAAEFFYFTTPTPGSGNTGGFLGFVEDTKFSGDLAAFHGRGYYDAPFDVTISTATSDATVRYTTDGTPPTATTGVEYSGPIHVDHTTTLRVAAFKDGFQPTNVDTQTYLFFADIFAQTGAGLPASWGGFPGDYEMDPDVVGVPANLAELPDDLRSLPVVSLVMPTADMFGPGSLHANPFADGLGSEKPVSVEFFDPLGREPGFAVNAGLRIQGDASRSHTESPKKGFRIAFRDIYGPGKLRYNLFENSPVEEFDTLRLKMGFGDSWTVPREHPKDSAFVRDAWTQQTFRDMGNTSPYSRKVHVYINGMYWGMYDLMERPDADWASSHFGGAEEDWDVIHDGAAIDGDATAWNAMFALANSGLSSPAAYAQMEQLLDIDEFIDYMIVNLVAYNQDWFGGAKNYYAVRQRNPAGKFQFIPWDNEHVLSIIGINRPLDTDLVNDFNTAGTASRLFQQLRANPEFRLRFADRAQQHLFGDGALTAEAMRERWEPLAAEINGAVVAESARWGDAFPPYNSPILPSPPWPLPLWTSPLGRSDVLAEQTRLYDTVFPFRTETALQQFRANSLYPSLDAPTFALNGTPSYGGAVSAGSQLAMLSGGTITTTTTLVATNATLAAFVPTNDDLEDDWLAPAYAQGAHGESWLIGASGVGYDTTPDYLPAIGINVEAQMSGPAGGTSVYVRAEFDIPTQADLDALQAADTSLLLRMLADDGFVAYLNGVEVASANAPGRDGQPGVLDWNSDAPTFVEVALGSPQEFDLSAFRSSLQVGANVLAIHGLNDANSSSDLLIRPELVGITTSPPPVPPAILYTTDGTDPRGPGAITYTGPFSVDATLHITARAFQSGEWSALADSLFTVPPRLRVSELYYNPPGSSDNAEFVELVNVGATPIDLTGVRLKLSPVDGDINYEFLTGEANLLLPAGGRIVIAGNRPGFLAAYPNVPAAVIADREFTGNLDNGGETITLFDASGGVIQSFTYDDAWYAETDGDGYSLVVADAAAPLSAWNQASGWRASLQLGGSPGEDERLIGDLDGDYRVGLVDLAILQSHFGIASNATMSDGDLNGDGAVNRSDVAVLAKYFGTSISPPQPSSAAAAIVVGRPATTSPPTVSDLSKPLTARRRTASRGSHHSALAIDEVLRAESLGDTSTAAVARRRNSQGTRSSRAMQR